MLSFAKDITKRYESVLNTSGNHSRIDYDRFLMTNIEYMKRTNPDKVKNLNKNEITLRYYWNVYGWYFLLVTIPPALFIAINTFTNPPLKLSYKGLFHTTTFIRIQESFKVNFGLDMFCFFFGH